MACLRYNSRRCLGRLPHNVPQRTKAESQQRRILVGDEYRFHIPPKVYAYQKRMGYQAPRYLYPINPNFHHWCFPREHLPASWNGSAPSPRNESNILNEEMFCQAMHQDDYMEKVYLCPTSEQEWFERQSMTPLSRHH